MSSEQEEAVGEIVELELVPEPWELLHVVGGHGEVKK